MNLEHELTQLGFSDKESRVYLALLELGNDTVQRISKKSGVNRATTYVILKSLLEKGVVSTYEKTEKATYVASEPSSLYYILDLQKKEVEERHDKLNKLLPHLQTRHNLNSNKPTIRFYEGSPGLMQGAKEFYAGFESKDKNVRMFYSKDKVLKNINKEVTDGFTKQRKQKGVSVRVIYTSSDENVPDQSPTSSRVRINEDAFPITIDLEILNDKVFISTLEKSLSAILIQNKDVAESMKTIFELAWLGAKTIEKGEG